MNQQQKNATKPPLISVLMPAYNVEKYIEAAIQAVLNQTFSDFELILVNDASTDQTGGIIARMAAQDKRITVVENPENLGFIGSLNKGLEYVCGEFVARTDSDDTTEPEWLATLLNEIQSDPELLAVSSNLRFTFDEKSSLLAKHYQNGEISNKPTNPDEIALRILFNNPMNHSAALIRSRVFTEMGVSYHPEYPYAEDYKLWLDIHKLGKMKNVPQPLVNYRLHANQASSAKQKQQGLSGRKVRREAIEWHFTQYGIDFRLPEQLSYADLYRLFQAADCAPAEQTELLNHILYECCMSLSHHSWRELAALFRSGCLDRFSSKQRLKIVKKHLRPQKYGAII